MRQPDWSFLLTLNIDVLSMDVYTNGDIIVSHHQLIRKFLEKGGILVWGIVPTNIEPFEKEGIDALEKRLTQLWDRLTAKGLDLEFLLSRSLLSPATCCLVNPDGVVTVEKAFYMIKALSQRLRERYNLM